MSRSIPKNVVTLTVMTGSGETIARQSMPRARYEARKASLQAFADAAYRRTHRVRFVRARVYAKDGDVIEELVHGYDARGAPIGMQSLRLEGLVLFTVTQAKKAMAKLIRGHQDAPPSFRRALVALTKREIAKGRTIVAVARELDMPSSSLTRRVENLPPRKRAPSRDSEPEDDDDETCALCLAMQRGLI